MVLDSFFVLFLLQLIFYTTRHLCIDIDVCFNLSIVFYLLLIGFSVFFIAFCRRVLLCVNIAWTLKYVL